MLVRGLVLCRVVFDQPRSFLAFRAKVLLPSKAARRACARAYLGVLFGWVVGVILVLCKQTWAVVSVILEVMGDG
jgi:hypothetical protein